MVSANDLLETDFPRIDANTPISKAIHLFSEVDSLIVTGEDGYRGVLRERDVMRAKIPLNSKAETYLTHVPKLSPDETAEETARLMVESGVYMLPVLDNNGLQGVVTADAILDVAAGTAYGDEPVKSYMSSPVISIEVGESVGKALKYFKEKDISRLPVMEDGETVGIVTMDDIVNRVIHPEEKAKGLEKHGEYIGEKKHYLKMPVEGIMVEKLLIMPPGATIGKVVEAMHEHGLRGMLIGRDATVQGIVTKKDLLEPIAALVREEAMPFVVQFAGPLDSLDEFDKREARSFLEDAVQTYREYLGNGYLYVHLKEHKETLRGISSIYCKMRLSTPRGMFIAGEEGWGAMHAIKNSFEVIERQIRKAEER
jgi:CBS domain-containing protein